MEWHARHGVIAVGLWVVAGLGGARVTGIASRMRSADVGRGFAMEQLRRLSVAFECTWGPLGMARSFGTVTCLVVCGVLDSAFFSFLDLAWLIFLFLATHLCDLL